MILKVKAGVTFELPAFFDHLCLYCCHNRIPLANDKKCEKVQKIIECIVLGNKLRSSGSTSANEQSSRSHSIFQIVLRHKAESTSAEDKLYGKVGRKEVVRPVRIRV